MRDKLARNSLTLSGASSALVLALAIGFGHSAHAQGIGQGQGQGQGRGSQVGNVYVMENDPAGNRVAVFERFADGSLRHADSVATGGLGAGDNAAADPLGSQDSMLLSEDGKHLYVVNAGSDSVSAFSVGERGELSLLQEVDSEGLFPASLAIDANLLYVLNSGGDGALAGFAIDENGELTFVPQSLRDLALGGPAFPAGDARNLAPGDIAFDTLNRRLLIAFLGGAALISFDVGDDGLPVAVPTITGSEGPAPFSLDFDDSGVAVVAEANGAVSSYDYNDLGALDTVSSSVANNQMATCWIQTTSLDLVYTSNTVSGTLSSYEISRNGEVTIVDEAAAADIVLPIDFALTDDDSLLYVTTGAGGVRGFRVDPSDGSLEDIGLFQGLPIFDEDGFAPQGLVVR